MSPYIHDKYSFSNSHFPSQTHQFTNMKHIINGFLQLFIVQALKEMAKSETVH
jgi:sensor histidine kinase regulating citrate/malate metabolism